MPRRRMVLWGLQRQRDGLLQRQRTAFSLQRLKALFAELLTREQADAYVDGTIDQPRALVAVPLAGSVVTTWRMPVDGEDPTGIWHRRYYGDGTMMAARADEGRA